MVMRVDKGMPVSEVRGPGDTAGEMLPVTTCCIGHRPELRQNRWGNMQIICKLESMSVRSPCVRASREARRDMLRSNERRDRQGLWPPAAMHSTPAPRGGRVTPIPRVPATRRALEVSTLSNAPSFSPGSGSVPIT